MKLLLILFSVPFLSYADHNMDDPYKKIGSNLLNLKDGRFPSSIVKEFTIYGEAPKHPLSKYDRDAEFKLNIPRIEKDSWLLEK